MGDGHEERDGDPILDSEIEVYGLIARDGAKKDHPEWPWPIPKMRTEDLCQVCRGTTWVIRANVDAEGELVAQVEPCDNPRCPHGTSSGPRPIHQLSFPHNDFAQSVTLPNGKVMAVK